MGVDAGDFDNDGDEDLFTTQLPGEGTDLYVNDGNGLFEDRARASGLGPGSLATPASAPAGSTTTTTAGSTCWRSTARSQASKDWRGERSVSLRRTEAALQNLGNGRFEDVTSRRARSSSVSEVSRGAAFGDIDNDGDIDVVVGNINGPLRLLINKVGNRNTGSACGWSAHADARATCSARGSRSCGKDGPTLWRRARADGSYASANDPRVLVGLGESTEVPTLRVHWPGGATENVPASAIDRWITVKEGQGAK